MKINSLQAHRSGTLCHRGIHEVGKGCVINSCWFFIPSPPQVRDRFLFTKRSTTVRFCNPSDELWMLPELIFIKSVMKKDQIFSLCPCFTEVQQQKCGLNISKFSCYLKTNSLHPLYYFSPPLKRQWNCFSQSLGCWIKLTGTKERVWEHLRTRGTLCLGVKAEGDDALPGVLKRDLLCWNCSTSWRGIYLAHTFHFRHTYAEVTTPSQHVTKDSEGESTDNNRSSVQHQITDNTCLEESWQEPARLKAYVKTNHWQTIFCIHTVFLWANLTLVKSLVSYMSSDWKTHLKYGMIVLVKVILKPRTLTWNGNVNIPSSGNSSRENRYKWKTF